MKKVSITYMVSDVDFGAFARAHAIFNKLPDGSVVVWFYLHDEDEIRQEEINAICYDKVLI